jgi:ubiquinone/menaquinone biosynthesis C-methylase UbiE
MNENSDLYHPAVHYYDSDYPSSEFSVYPENFDEITKYQGLAFDVARYKEIASETNGRILELCCGTGRVAIPLAREGFEVMAVDISEGMLAQFASNLEREEPSVSDRIKTVQQDIVQLALEERNFSIAIIAFNSLLLVLDFQNQCRALRAVAKHMLKEGLLILDIVNPLNLKLQGDPIPKPFFTRKNPHNGNTYTRFAMLDPFDENHKQRLHGYYDEVDGDGGVKRQYYSMHWRPIFRFEIELMLKQAGFEIISIEGGHLKEAYAALSPRMFIQARKT